MARNHEALRAENKRLKLKLAVLVEACQGIIWRGRGDMRDWTEDPEKIEAFDKAVIEAMAEMAEKEDRRCRATTE